MKESTGGGGWLHPQTTQIEDEQMEKIYTVSNPYDNTKDMQRLNKEELLNKIMGKIAKHLEECDSDQPWVNVVINTGGYQPTTCITISEKEA